MRLWHKDLISVLPREQLVAQWRELSAIAGAIQKNGTPNHGLVNFVLELLIAILFICRKNHVIVVIIDYMNRMLSYKMLSP